MPEEIEHIWEEGNKRPKTQNERSRRKNSTQECNSDHSDIFPIKNPNQNHLYEIPIIVVRNDDKNRKILSAKKNSAVKTQQRPSTFKPEKSNIVSSLDPEFLNLFQR